jgi:hypothetical protein
MEIQYSWNGYRRGQLIKTRRDVYWRDDGVPGGSIFYEPPGRCIVKRGMIGTFIAKTNKGVLVQFKNGTNGILGLVIDDYAIEEMTS